jgi:ABC-type dipeptide/oligopeptide/nickel transport system permease component
MLRYALRRVLWAIPTLLGTSLILFFVTTLAPAPEARPGTAPTGAAAEEARRRFLDLPRFVNESPADVRSRSREEIAHIAANDGRRDAAARALQRMGGAALPYVLPALEALPPEARRRLAADLAPVAIRMGIAQPGEVDRPETAVLFWTRFWDDRSLDFTPAAVSRAVARLVEHDSYLREADLISLDTFALQEVTHAMTTTSDRVALQRLTRIAAHASQRGMTLGADATPLDIRRAIADWQEWWFVHATDFVALEGGARMVAVVTETRYGKWLKRAVSGELGVSPVDGEPVSDKLRARAPVTLLLCGLALLSSLALAVPLGAIGAWRQGHPFDVASSAVLFLLYATPTFALAELLQNATAGVASPRVRMALAVASLAAGSLATLSRWQRASMLDVVRQDFVRTAHAKGLPGWRVAVVHVLRYALLPTITLAGLQLPVLLSGAIVVEEVFGLPGVGYETLRAVRDHDDAWLMAIVLVSAAGVALGLVASDIAQGVLDPRVRDVLTQRQGGGQA